MKMYDNKGFTLIEVLLSITIIAILFVSILHTFVNTAKISQVAKQEQNTSVIAQNIMETLRTTTLEDTAIQYAKSGYQEGMISASNKFIKFDTPSVVSSISNGATIYSFQPPAGRDIFRYAITNLEENGVSYDALVTLDMATYKDTNKYANTMNNYQMPQLLMINENIVAIIDMDHLQATGAYDAEAISYFKSFHATYINAIEAKPTPIPAHNHVSDAEIDAAVTKNIVMTLSKDTINNEFDISCYLEYSCPLDLNDDGILDVYDSDEIYSGTYSMPSDLTRKSDIYLFYMPSIFATDAASTRQDTISIINKDSVNANIYIAYQSSSSTKTPVKIMKLTSSGEDNSGAISVFTNFQGTINSSTISAGDLFDMSTLECRIYKITVTIYGKGSILKNDFSDPYITLTSVKEE